MHSSSLVLAVCIYNENVSVVQMSDRISIKFDCKQLYIHFKMFDIELYKRCL